MECVCALDEGKEIHVSSGDWIDLYIEVDRGSHYIVACGEGTNTMKIVYCPFCGRHLDRSGER